MRNKPEIRAQESGGNIFADLDLPNPEQELLKAQLTLQIYRIIKQRGLTQARAGEILGIKPPHVSALAAWWQKLNIDSLPVTVRL